MSVRTYVLLGFLGAIVLGAFLPLQPETAVASMHGATRSFSAPWVLPEGELRVTVLPLGTAASACSRRPCLRVHLCDNRPGRSHREGGGTDRHLHPAGGGTGDLLRDGPPPPRGSTTSLGSSWICRNRRQLPPGPRLSGLARSRRTHPHQRPPPHRRPPPRRNPRSRPTRRRPPLCSPRRRRRCCRGRRPCPRPRQRRDLPRPRQPLLRRLPSLRTKRRRAVRLSICGCRWYCLWSPF